jgi:predicted component of type VI protein secretion system
MKALLVKSGPQAGHTYPISCRTLIGRGGECDIQVIDRGVSRKHACVLEQEDGSVLVRDLRSQNGTLVDGQRTLEAVLNPGDQFVVGDSCFEYRTDVEDEDTRASMDIKLVSGPAEVSTVSGNLSEAEREEIMAVVRAKREAAARATAPGTCCDSPLALKARQERWNFCPACGRPPSP